MKRFKIRYIRFLILFLFVFLLSGCASSAGNNTMSVSSDKLQISTNKQQGIKSDENGNLIVHFINVGQADSILIQQGSKYMLIDAGNNGDGKLVKNYLLKQGVKSLDYVIGTHPHEDHIGGLDYIINDFKIGKIYLPKVTSTTKAFGDVIVAIKNKGMKVSEPKPGETFNLGTAKCTILAPNNSKYKDLNNYSVVVKLEFGSNSFLLTGDAEDISEGEILAKGFNIKADLLKVGHHGSRSSTTDKFLNKVNPKYAVISSETGNDYGHPHKETMDKLKNKNISVYRTDELGTIIATSNGKTISFNTKPGSYKAGQR
ncbi:MBL fold metallo-hydrolase [Clostridium tagluense]|uniref:ComEC/Rec2 family competence protein n=1 Tax=Clostridium tagluense TaxID=360422 RepID=UPI001CF38362|nr:ComEC/Rec2 family competence protein [Clostridium tagluense]MCB2310571.1 MBL fold metallo-hydrolase [Clostridium tagluense]MCB2315263.1 MBL fold metallo-hydrolase [Clostridium tagluense]MCB2320114.1 MBL fold metallo-hydrolase [Clostridium tagluense]MCB2325005.1 MBL fold metallo-hydrolase [Clostridium tagluense]MCB2329857.1 MBL fold metallo-hydrolase [Clostridium tagluense]